MGRVPRLCLVLHDQSIGTWKTLAIATAIALCYGFFAFQYARYDISARAQTTLFSHPMDVNIEYLLGIQFKVGWKSCLVCLSRRGGFNVVSMQ